MATTVDARHHRAAEVLADGGSYQDAADAAGVSKATAWRWANDDVGSDVPKLVARILEEREEATRNRAVRYAEDALERMHQLMTEAESEYTQLQAARTLWNSYMERERQTHMDRTLAVIKALDQLDDGGEW